MEDKNAMRIQETLITLIVVIGVCFVVYLIVHSIHEYSSQYQNNYKEQVSKCLEARGSWVPNADTSFGTCIVK